MTILASTSDIIRVVTTSTSRLNCIGSYADSDGSAARKDTAVTSATTTTVVASPGAATQRNVLELNFNNSGAASQGVTVQHYDGTTSVDLASVTLAAGEALVMSADGLWQHLTPAGVPYAWQPPAPGNLGATGTLAETFPRELTIESSANTASGTIYYCPIKLYAGQVVTNITFWAGTTAAASTTSLQFALYGPRGTLLASSAVQNAYTWSANTVTTLAMQSAFTVPVTACYYVAVLQIATTTASLKQGPARSAGTLFTSATGYTPLLQSTQTGLSALPSVWASVSATTSPIYATVS